MSNTDLINSLGIATSAIGGLAGTLGSAIGSRSEQKRQYKYNMEMAKWQNDVNISNWQMQNEYNLPQNQMARLQAAGLNPNLVYGSGTSTTASTPAGVSQPSSPALRNWDSILNHALGSIPSLLDQALKVAQIDKVSQETSNLSSYQRNLNLEGDLKELDMIARRYGNAKSQYEAEIWKSYWDNKIIGMRADNELKDAQRFNLDSMRSFRDGVQTENLRSSTARNMADVALNSYRRNLMSAQISLTLAQAGLTRQQTENATQALSNLIMDYDLKGREYDQKTVEYQITKLLLETGVNLKDNSEIGNAVRGIYGIFNQFGY